MYAPLPMSPDAETFVEQHHCSHKQQALRTFVMDLLAFVACIAAILSSALTIFLAFSHLGTEKFEPSTNTGRRPSTYINLDKLYPEYRGADQGSRTPLPPFNVFAHIILQVDTNDPQRALHEHHRKYYSSEGLIYPDDRHVIVSPQKSTIIQFMNQDFGMEECTLEMSIPPQNATWDVGTKVRAESLVEIWLLDGSQELNRHYQWAQAPKRKSLFAVLELFSENDSQSLPFHCPSASFSTFEFVCSKKALDCHVEFWQQKDTSNPNGIYITQHESGLV